MQSCKGYVKLHPINCQPFRHHNKNRSLIFMGPCSCHKSCSTQISALVPTIILNAVSQRKMWSTSFLCWTKFSGVLASRAGDPSGVAFQPASMSLILPNVSISHTKESLLENAVNVSPWYSPINEDQWQKYLLTRNGMKGKLSFK